MIVFIKRNVGGEIIEVNSCCQEAEQESIDDGSQAFSDDLITTLQIWFN